MSDWKAKRFWTETRVVEGEGGFGVQLDARDVKTPAKAPLIVPTRALADAIAAEWAAQEGKIDPLSMPVTRAANAAIDKVTPQFDEVAAMIADYGGTDLICYRADSPEELICRQAAAWDPLLDWARDELGAPLDTATGVMFHAQPEQSLATLRRKVTTFDPFQLAAFHDLVGLSGSLILGFAVTHARLQPQDAWNASRIDEDWQVEQWGVDDDAARQARQKESSFMSAAEIFALSSIS